MALTLLGKGATYFIMKTRHQFKSEKDYRNYLVAYFSSVVLPHVMDHEYGNEDHAIDYSIAISKAMVKKLSSEKIFSLEDKIRMVR